MNVNKNCAEFSAETRRTATSRSERIAHRVRKAIWCRSQARDGWLHRSARRGHVIKASEEQRSRRRKLKQLPQGRAVGSSSGS